MRTRLKGGPMTKTPEEQLAKALKKTTVTSDVLVKLFRVFRESISQANNDKRYWIEKLQLYNSIGEALSDRQKNLQMQWQTPIRRKTARSVRSPGDWFLKNRNET